MNDNIEFKFVTGFEGIEEIKKLFLEYAQSLGVNLDFQNFDEEFKNLPGEYGPPTGALLLVLIEGKEGGCVALRNLGQGNHYPPPLISILSLTFYLEHN